MANPSPTWLWTRPTPACPRGLALARERGEVLTWDARDGLQLLSRAGAVQAHRTAPAPLTAVCCADDGSASAAAGQGGQVWLLAPDLSPRWERALPRRAVAVALDPFGQYLAAADDGGTLHLFDRTGRPLWQAPNPRPLHHLAFVPERPLLVGAADYGLVACFDLAGNCAWRDGLVAHVGSLACSGAGDVIALACYTEGLCCYAAGRSRPERLAQAAPCRLAALSYDGMAALTAGLDGRLFLRRGDGTARAEFAPAGKAVALALGPLGDYALLARAEGGVAALDLSAAAARG